MNMAPSPLGSNHSTRLPWNLASRGIALALFALSLVKPARAADVISTWNGGSSVWGDAANWTPNAFFPNNGNGGSTYDVVLSNGGAIDLDQDITIEKFALSSGGVSGGFDLTLNDQLTWSSGTMSGAGTTNANGGILIDGMLVTLDERTLVNAAGQTATLASRNFFHFRNGAVFSNDGTMVMELGAINDFSDVGGGGVFSNAGTAVFMGAGGGPPGSVFVSGNMVLNNSGTLVLESEAEVVLGDDVIVTQYNDDTLTGGVWRIGGFLSLPRTGTGIVTNQADITLTGVSRFSAGTSRRQLQQTLTMNSGALRVISSLFNFIADNDLSNSGIIELESSSLSAPQLTNTASGEIFGFGSVGVRPVSSGLIRSAGGTLQFDKGFAGDGTAQIDAGSALNLSQGTEGSSAALLVHNGADPDSLDLGANDFTVESDYSNANFGEGNSFDPRTNVAGAGLILAAGDVAQVLMGDVIDGEMAAPELAFGNLHLGDMATRVYQIGSVGTSGPSLRGAIQTRVNGGNVTDARLSGDGLIAANFGPLTPGESSADQTVIFNATDVGALTEQAVQVPNNFDNVANQTLAITGAVFRLAQPAVPAGNEVNFGILHVGDVPQASVTVENAAAADGFSEALNAEFSSTTGDANGAGDFTLLAPGDSDIALSVSIDVSSAGDKSGTVFFDMVSDGTGTSELGMTDLGMIEFTVLAQVNNFALPIYRFDSGDAILTGSGDAFTLDFGTVGLGAAMPQARLSLSNGAVDPADSLAGDFAASAPDFMLEAFDDFSGVTAGQSLSPLTVSFETDQLGFFDESIVLNPRSQNASGFDGSLTPVTLAVRGTVVPEPSTLSLLALAAPLLARRRRGRGRLWRV